MRTISVLIFFICHLQVLSQVTEKISIYSSVLNEQRAIEIILPKGYQSANGKFPVIYCLDGEYTQYPVVSALTFNAYLEKFPNAIVVAIHQNYADSISNRYKRWDDCDYNPKLGLLSEKGQKFSHFISKELIPYIDSNYSSSTFRIIVGHSFTANYINYFLLDGNPIFRAFIAISPYYDINSIQNLTSQLKNLKTPILYYNAVGEYDLKKHIRSVNQFNKKLISELNNSFFKTKTFSMKDNRLGHYGIVEFGVVDGLKFIFSRFQTISSEYDELLKAENKLEFLTDYYSFLKDFYDFETPIRLEDYEAVAEAAKGKKQFDQLNVIAKKCLNDYPNNWEPYYMLGDVEKQKKNYANALNYYEMGYQKLGDEVLNKDDFYHDISELKKLIEATKK